MARSRTAHALVMAGLLAAGAPAGPAAAKEPQLAFMQGTWSGATFRILLDTERMMANTDPAKPFQREDLVIRNITDRMVTFSVGNRRFIGLFDGNQLSLAGEDLPETVTLSRISPRR